jgi:predicted aconitase
MYLTKEEERIYDGEFGWANQVCMNVLVKLGDLFNASKLIPIESAHVSGVSYKTIGDAGLDFLKALADAEGRSKVRATLNPQSFDCEYLEKRLPENLVKKQQSILRQFDRIGFAKSLTCTPYFLSTPAKNSHLAWAESSAIVYANSVLGAWTNREGGPSAVAAAIAGKTPDYGIHRVENRQPKILVDVDAQMKSERDFGALGFCLGKMLEDKIPLIRGLRQTSNDDLKQLSAALASSGMVNMFNCEVGGFRKDTGNMEKLTIEAEDIRQTVEHLSTASAQKPDLVFLGCPHCSFEEVERIASLLGNRKVKAGMEFWVCTSRYVKEKAGSFVETIEKSGGHVLADVCTIVSWPETLGIKTIMTDSAKTAYYAPTLNKAETILAPMTECLNMVLER